MAEHSICLDCTKIPLLPKKLRDRVTFESADA